MTSAPYERKRNSAIGSMYLAFQRAFMKGVVMKDYYDAVMDYARSERACLRDVVVDRQSKMTVGYVVGMMLPSTSKDATDYRFEGFGDRVFLMGMQTLLFHKLSGIVKRHNRLGGDYIGMLALRRIEKYAPERRYRLMEEIFQKDERTLKGRKGHLVTRRIEMAEQTFCSDDIMRIVDYSRRPLNHLDDVLLMNYMPDSGGLMALSVREGADLLGSRAKQGGYIRLSEFEVVVLDRLASLVELHFALLDTRVGWEAVNSVEGNPETSRGHTMTRILQSRGYATWFWRPKGRGFPPHVAEYF